jgi:chromosome segregation ATPase
MPQPGPGDRSTRTQNALEKELARIESEITGLREKERDLLERTLKQFKSLASELKGECEERYSDLKESALKLGAAKKDREWCEEKEKRLKAKIKKLEADEKAVRRDEKQGEQKLKDLREEHKKIEEELRQGRQDLKSEEAELKDDGEEIQWLTDDIQGERKKKIPDYTKLQKLETRLGKKSIELDKKRKKHDDRVGKLDHKKWDLERLEKQIAAAEPKSPDKRKKLEEELDQKRKKLDAIEKDVLKTKNEVLQLDVAMTDAEARLTGTKLVEDYKRLASKAQKGYEALGSEISQKEELIKLKKKELEKGRGDGKDGRENRLKGLVSRLGYCRDSQAIYVDPNRRGTVKTDRNQRQIMLNKVYQEFTEVVGIP